MCVCECVSCSLSLSKGLRKGFPLPHPCSGAPRIGDRELSFLRQGCGLGIAPPPHPRGSLSRSLSLSLSFCLSIHPSIHPSVCPSVHPSIHPSIHPSTCKRSYIYMYKYIYTVVHTYIHYTYMYLGVGVWVCTKAYTNSICACESLCLFLHAGPECVYTILADMPT